MPNVPGITNQKCSRFFSAGMVIDYNGGAVSYTTSKYYDLLISCTDIGSNTIYSNFVVDIIKNEPPSLTNLPGKLCQVYPQRKQLVFERSFYFSFRVVILSYCFFPFIFLYFNSINQSVTVIITYITELND